MIIEITGTNFNNKGAELMLAAVVARLRDTAPEIGLAVRPPIGAFTDRCRYGLFQVLDARDAGGSGWLVERLLHEGYRRRFGMVAEPDVKVVLDASGYSLGDPWDPFSIERRAMVYERMRRHGTKIVLLPQAIGPLNDARVRAGAARVLNAAEIVFARDPDSLECAGSVMASSARLRLAPDFTTLIPGRVPPGIEVRSDWVALVPNTRMVVSASADAVKEYVLSFATVAETVRSAGLSPILVVHESTSDRSLADQIAAASNAPLPVLEHRDPLVLKGIIGSCVFTVGSRFHGLVSALSQAVPSIGTSWSHKYQHLFADYGIPEFLCRAVTPHSVAEMVGRLLDIGAREEIRGKLISAGALQRSMAERMWREVFDVIAGAVEKQSPSGK